MTISAGIAACIILGLLALFQLALASGAPLGEFAWGGKAKVLPTGLRVGSIVSVLAYAIIAIILLERAGAIHIVGNAAVIQVAAWVVFAYFARGIVMNAISRSKRERCTMTPWCLFSPRCPSSSPSAEIAKLHVAVYRVHSRLS